MQVFSLRTRTALFIAAAFSALLALFCAASYIAIETALIDRSDSEARDALLRILRQLERGERDTLTVVNRNRSTGESELRISLYDHGMLIWGDPSLLGTTVELHVLTGASSAINLPGDRRAVSMHRSQQTAIAIASTIVTREAGEAILWTFIVLLAIGLLLSWIVGYFVAGLSLAPIQLLLNGVRALERHRDHTNTVSATALPVPEHVEEVATLARGVNRLIAERDASIARLQTFTADAAHELRTPLTVLKGELEVELRLTSPGSAAYGVYQSNLEEVERLIAIVQDLLMLAAIDSAEPTEYATADASAAIERVIERLRPIASAKAIALDVSLTRSLNVKADSERLQRMMYNLVHNAIAYTEQGKTVRVSLVQSERVTLIVEDEGVGIAATELPHIFDRFYRTEQSRNRSSGGAGLGLAIVQSIAAQYHFDITVRSMPGRGTTITVLL